MPRPGEDRPRKWIFQCKLVSGKGSLSATKVVDIGDLLDHYDVGGYGVMTSAPIDATLYDKLDAVCDRRGVEKMAFSVLELERSEEHTSELQSLMRISYAVFCLKKKTHNTNKERSP